MSTYDIALADLEEFFSHRVRELCGFNNLTFFLVEPLWVQEFLGKLQQGEIAVGVLLDMASNPYDPSNLYYRLAREVKATGGYVIDDPDRSPFATHKAKFHGLLLERGVPVPETLVLQRQDLSSFRITDEVKRRVGMPFVVKPGWGSGRQGVILGATSEADIARSAQMAPNSDTLLIQRQLTPRSLDGRPGWFRVFYICGEVVPCWWHPTTGNYEMVSPMQRRRFGLLDLDQIVYKIARLSKMEFFSTEVALTEDGFVAVDYLNDECDLHAKSFWPSGPPDELVRHIAWVMVQKAISVLHKHPFQDELVERDRAWQQDKIQKLRG